MVAVTKAVKATVRDAFPPIHEITFVEIEDGLVAEVDAESLLYNQDLLIEELGGFLVEADDREAVIDIDSRYVLRIIASPQLRR